METQLGTEPTQLDYQTLTDMVGEDFLPLQKSTEKVYQKHLLIIA